MTKLFSEMTTERLKAIYSHVENTIANARSCSIDLLERRDAMFAVLSSRGAI